MLIRCSALRRARLRCIGADSKGVGCAGEPGSTSGGRVGWPHIPAFSSFNARPLKHSLRSKVLGGGHQLQ